MPTITLHALAPSHPCMTADAALRLKGLEFERVDFPPGPHIEQMAEIYGEGNTTVPGMTIDDERVHTSRAILARLEELEPDPTLFPEDRAEAVREAEKWGDEQLQDLGRRMPWGALHFRPEAMGTFGGAGPLDGPGTDFAIKLIRGTWKYHGLSAELLANDLKGLPAKLDHIDQLAADGVIGTERGHRGRPADRRDDPGADGGRGPAAADRGPPGRGDRPALVPRLHRLRARRRVPRGVGARAVSFEAWDVELHGHRMVYRVAGDGPPVVLIHGMVNNSRHWRSVALALAERYTVIAPDLIGHGDSASPRVDYSLGGHATRIRDLLASLGVDRASMIGHSYGGGVAMQFFWQFPQRTDRLMLVSAGGLGPEVSPMLRSAALPGAVGAAVGGRPPARGRRAGGRGHHRPPGLARAAAAVGPGPRQAFLQTLRSVIDVRGQRVSARDRLYLLSHAPTPTQIVWGGRDHTIPVAHGEFAHRAVPHSRFDVLPKAAHFPHLEDPDGLARVLGEFLEETEPAPVDDADWGDVIAERAPRSRVGA